MKWKCIYCDKEFDSKKEVDKHELICSKHSKNKFLVDNLKTVFLYFWLSTIITFLVCLIINIKFSKPQFPLLNNQFLLVMFLGNILIGTITFFIMAFLSSTKRQLPFFFRFSFFVSLAYFFLNTAVFASTGYAVKLKNENSPVPSAKIIPTVYISPTTTKTPTPTISIQKENTVQSADSADNIDCIGPDGKKFKTTQKECDKFNSAWNNEKVETESQPSQTRVNCSGTLSGSSFTYNFGTISLSECSNNIIKLKQTLSQPNPQPTVQTSNSNPQALQECLKVPNQKLADYNKQVSASGLGDYASNPYVLQIKSDIQKCYSKYGQN